MAFRSALLSFVAFAVTSFHASELARADFSCQDRLISPGALAYEVQLLCGPPDATDRRVETRSVRRPVSVPCRAGRCVVLVDDTVDVTIDEWTYDFGPRRFIQLLVFEQGKLLAIHAGGYGHKLE